MPEQERQCCTLVAASALVPAAALGPFVGRPRAQRPEHSFEVLDLSNNSAPMSGEGVF